MDTLWGLNDTGLKANEQPGISLFSKNKKILHSHWLIAVPIHIKSVFGPLPVHEFYKGYTTQRKCAPCFSNGFVSRNVCSLLSPPQHPNTAEDVVEVQV